MQAKEQELQPRTKHQVGSQDLATMKEQPLNPTLSLNKIKEQNEAIFNSANEDRKTYNLEKIRQYVTKRVESFKERSAICDVLRANLQQKQKNTRAFLKSIIRFFEDYADLYSSLNKSIGKLDLKKKYDNHSIYTAIKDSIGELIQMNDEQMSHINKFVDWLEKILVEAFKSAETYFKERMKKVNKDVETSQSNYLNNWAKEAKHYEKLVEGSDLLEKQLTLMEDIKNTNETAITRIVDLNQAWQFLLEQQNTIKKLLKDNILQFHQRFIKFHKKTQCTTSIFKYWSNMAPSANAVVVYSSFLDDRNIEYINFGCKSKRLADNFENFMRMTYEEERVGNPYPLLDILIVKKYNSKLQLSQRDWKQVKLIFTVDSNLLILDEKQGKIILKLLESSVKLKRVSENILEISGTEQGVIFNSKKKQSIHFETLDQVEEFVFYVNSIPQKKRDK